MSTHVGRTSKEAPSDAELPGHKLLVRAGMIRRLASGVYAYLPSGLRVLRKLEHLIREEMENAGYAEFQLPVLQPREFWEAAGRWKQLGETMFRLQDRNDHEFCLAFTNEEVTTTLVAEELDSYRQLPMRIFLIQRKFRDEPRPRGGLVRLREFLMKDAYSFDRDAEAMERSYTGLLDAYRHMYERLQLPVTFALGDSGVMGGKKSHEVMWETEFGEDTIVCCTRCTYSANVEVASAARSASTTEYARTELPSDVHTPGVRTIEELARFLNLPATNLLKTMVYMSAAGAVAALLPGDAEVNLVKLARVVGDPSLRPATGAEIVAVGGIPGYCGPQGLQARLVADLAVGTNVPFVVGANSEDTHRFNVQLGRDYAADLRDIALVKDGDACPQCGSPLRLTRAIELGHLFQLGTRYSAAVGATFLDEHGASQPLYGGSYGIGLDRLMAVVAEHYHDSRGLCWPREAAPFDAHICVLQRQNDQVANTADRVAERLAQRGVAVLLDDRGESAGVQFADADLVGSPIRITISPRTLGKEAAEVKARTAQESEVIGLDRVVEHVCQMLQSA